MLKKIIDRIFPHKHRFETEFVYHDSEIVPVFAGACTAKIRRCKCGHETREITPAGYQQIRWGDDPRKVAGHLF
jgi:hypothetical protein